MYIFEHIYPKAHIDIAHECKGQLCLDLVDIAKLKPSEAAKMGNVIVNVMKYLSENHQLPWFSKLCWEEAFMEDVKSEPFSYPKGSFYLNVKKS